LYPRNSSANYNIVSDFTITNALNSLQNGANSNIISGAGQIFLQGDLNLQAYALFTANDYLIELNGSGTQNVICGVNCRGPGLRINSTGSVVFPSYFGTNGGIRYQAGNVDLSNTRLALNWPHSDAYLELPGLPVEDLRFSKDGGYDVNVIGTVVTDGVSFDTVMISGMNINGGEIQINNSLDAPAASGGSTQFRFVGSNDATISVDTTDNLPGSGIIVDKTGGVLNFVGNVNLNISGEDFNILQGDVRMNTYSLNINDNLNVAAGSTLYTDCGTLTYASLTGTGTITSSEATPQISISDLLLEEGETGDVVVSLNLPNCSNTITVDYVINQVTATLGDNDFTSSDNFSGTLSFAPGEYQKTINIQSIEDTIMEDDETLTIDLSNPSNATITDAQAVVTINNDDTSNFIWVGGIDSNWSTAGNWQGGAVPTSTDVAFFNSTCGANCNVNIDGNIDVLGIRTDATYTGTITQLSGNTITIGSGDLRMKGGTFVGGDSLIDLNGDLELNNVSFTSTSGRFEIGYNDNVERFEGVTIINGANFVHNSGTLALIATRGVNTASEGTTAIFNLDADLNLNHFEINGNDSHTWPNRGNVIYRFDNTEKVIVNGDFNFIDGYLQGGTIELKGDLTVHGNGAAFADGGSTKIEFTSTSPQTIDLSGSDPTNAILPHLVLNSTSTLSVHFSDSSLKAFGLSLLNGTFESPNLLELTVDRHSIGQDVNISNYVDFGLSVQGGTFNHNNGKVLFSGELYVNYNGGVSSFIDIPLGLQLYDVEINVQDSWSAWGSDNAAIYLKDGHVLSVLNNLTIKDGMFARGQIDLSGDLYLEYTDAAIRAEGGYGVVNFSDGGSHTIYAQDGSMAPSIKIASSTTLSVDAATTDFRITSLDIDATSTFNAHTGTLKLGSYIHDMGRPFVYYLSDNYETHAGSIGLIVNGTFNALNTDLHINPGQHGENSVSIFKIDLQSPVTVANLKFQIYSTYVANRGLTNLHNSSSFNVLGDLTLTDGRVGEVVAGATSINVGGNLLFENIDADVFAVEFHPSINFNGNTDQSLTIQTGSLLSATLESSKAAGNLDLLSDLNLAATGADFIVGDTSVINMNGNTLDINDELNMSTNSVLNQSGGSLVYGSWNGQGTINP
jgi:hypothetical protein